MGVIYRITCKTSGKRYIGQTKHTSRYRWHQHVWEANHPEANQSRKLNNAICKYGPDDFIIEDIVVCDDKDLDHHEVICIEREGTFLEGYNLTKGGKYQQEVSQETRDKLSKALKGKPKNVKDNRKRNEDNCLPKYLKHYVDAKCEGYKVSDHPRLEGISVSFTKTDESMEVKFMKALDVLDSLNAGTYVVEKKAEPKGIQQIPNGYRVRVKGHPVRTFQKANLSMEEKFQIAQEYLNTLN
jgi:group I intron endonuclease